jgi:hypothetical protein
MNSYYVRTCCLWKKPSALNENAKLSLQVPIDGQQNSASISQKVIRWRSGLIHHTSCHAYSSSSTFRFLSQSAYFNTNWKKGFGAFFPPFLFSVNYCRSSSTHHKQTCLSFLFLVVQCSLPFPPANKEQYVGGTNPTADSLLLECCIPVGSKI